MGRHYTQVLGERSESCKHPLAYGARTSEMTPRGNRTSRRSPNISSILNMSVFDTAPIEAFSSRGTPALRERSAAVRGRGKGLSTTTDWSWQLSSCRVQEAVIVVDNKYVFLFERSELERGRPG